jgi:3-oxoacyl-[acyl-carrier-protein] synthase III
MTALLRAFGSYVPARAVSNAELAARLHCEPDWIANVSGIQERRWAADSESVVDMAVYAGAACLHDASMDPREIAMVIVSSGSAPRRFPGPASETAARLGLAGIPALDVPIASAGSLFAMAIAAQFSTSGAVLVIASEKMSAVIESAPLDRSTAILFGDGAGACLVHPKEGRAKITHCALHSDGNSAGDLRLDLNQPIHMNGSVVIRHVSQKVPDAIREVLAADHRSPGDVGAFLMHQANHNLIVRIAKSLEVAPEKFYSNIARYGNTSSASLLIAASEWRAAHDFTTGEPVVFAAFGAGFHWGALLAIGV